MATYYDLVLGAIPAVLIGVTAVLSASGVGLTTAVPVASTVALGVMFHAMFVNAPDPVAAAEATAVEAGRPERAEAGRADGQTGAGVAPPNAD